MIELCIPQAGEETKNSKDLVFSILSEQDNLTTMEITRGIRKRFNARVTYQAIKKAIDALIEKGVLTKKEKKYRINKQWLITVKTKIDSLLMEYEKDYKFPKFSSELLSKEYAVYTFSNLIDLDNFWDDMVLYLAEHLKKEEEHIFISRTHYSWFALLNLGREAKVFEALKKKVKCSFLIIEDNPLNQWASTLYHERFGKCIIVNMKANECESLNLLGDTIIQVQYPPKLIKKMKTFYKKYSSVEGMSVKDLTEFANEEGDIKFIVYRNPEIAESMRNKYLAYFKT